MCCWGTGLPYGLHVRRTGHNLPRGLSADWWELTTANAAMTNDLTYLPKHEGVRDNKFWSPIRDTHVLPKLVSYEKHCRRDRW
jgi:hypothetical protein